MNVQPLKWSWSSLNSFGYRRKRLFNISNIHSLMLADRPLLNVLSNLAWRRTHLVTRRYEKSCHGVQKKVIGNLVGCFQSTGRNIFRDLKIAIFYEWKLKKSWNSNYALMEYESIWTPRVLLLYMLDRFLHEHTLTAFFWLNLIKTRGKRKWILAVLLISQHYHLQPRKYSRITMSTTFAD